MKKITLGSVSESNGGGDICASMPLAEIEVRGWTEAEDGEFHGRAADSDTKIHLLVKTF